VAASTPVWRITISLHYEIPICKEQPGLSAGARRRGITTTTVEDTTSAKADVKAEDFINGTTPVKTSWGSVPRHAIFLYEKSAPVQA